nr:hypothetical protein HmN_000558900 [Hymenolepis microstoma]
MESNEKEERPDPTSTRKHSQSSSNLSSAGNTPTQDEEKTNTALKTTNLQAGRAYPSQVLQNAYTYIHVLIPKISIFDELEKSLLLLNSIWTMGFLEKPLFSFSIRYLYFDSMLPLLLSRLNSHVVRQICDLCFTNMVPLEIADLILYFAVPELPLKRVIEKLIHKLRANQLLVVAFFRYKGGRYVDENDCLLDMIWSLYGKYGDEVQEISNRVHFCFIHHGRRGVLELDTILDWGCKMAARNKTM